MHLVQILLPLNDDERRRFPAQAFEGLALELTEKFGGVTSFTRTPQKVVGKRERQLNMTVSPSSRL